MDIDQNRTALSVKHQENGTIVEDGFPATVTFFRQCTTLYA